MPEINPLTNNQIFLKKIAENTGSNYETGDVSEINPLTIDQILLKEIAANTAGQSGDITDLKGKVADNTGAIEAINENGCCNVFNLDNPQRLQGVNVSSTGFINTQTDSRDFFYFVLATFDINGQQIELLTTDQISATGHKKYTVTIPNDNYYTLQMRHNGGARDLAVYVDAVPAGEYVIEFDVIGCNPTVVDGLDISNIMLYDARLNPTGYVPYAMTNRELTEKVVVLTQRIDTVISVNALKWAADILNVPSGYIPLSIEWNADTGYSAVAIFNTYMQSNNYYYLIFNPSDNTNYTYMGTMNILCVKA